MKNKIKVNQKVRIRKGAYAIQTNFFFNQLDVIGIVESIDNNTAYVRLNQSVIIDCYTVNESVFNISDLEAV